MNTRLLAGVLPLALMATASAMGTIASAAPLAAVSSTIVTSQTTFVIQNAAGQVVVNDGAGKALASVRSATPAIRAIVTISTTPSDAAAKDGKSKFYKASIKLQDQKGQALWSKPVLFPADMSAKFNAHWNPDVKGVWLEFSSVPAPADTPAAAASDVNVSDDPSPVIIDIGADGQIISAKAEMGDGHLAVSPERGVDVKASGVKGGGRIKFNSDGDNAVLEVNGEKIPVTVIERDGKHYMTFPWHGHKISLDAACTFKFNEDGDITIDGPASGK